MEQNNNFKWYILNVMAGQEKKIAGDIKTLIMRGGAISKDVSEVIVPTKPIIKIKKGVLMSTFIYKKLKLDIHIIMNPPISNYRIGLFTHQLLQFINNILPFCI